MTFWHFTWHQHHYTAVSIDAEKWVKGKIKYTTFDINILLHLILFACNFVLVYLNSSVFKAGDYELIDQRQLFCCSADGGVNQIGSAGRHRMLWTPVFSKAYAATVQPNTEQRAGYSAQWSKAHRPNSLIHCRRLNCEVSLCDLLTIKGYVKMAHLHMLRPWYIGCRPLRCTSLQKQKIVIGN